MKSFSFVLSVKSAHTFTHNIWAPLKWMSTVSFTQNILYHYKRCNKVTFWHMEYTVHTSIRFFTFLHFLLHFTDFMDEDFVALLRLIPHFWRLCRSERRRFVSYSYFLRKKDNIIIIVNVHNSFMCSVPKLLLLLMPLMV